MGLIEALSHQSTPVRHLLEQALTWEDAGQSDLPSVKPYRTARQLRQDEIDELVEQHQAGVPVCDLARRFGIHRATVSRQLSTRGVLTVRGLASEDVPAAVEQYASGWSLVRIGKHYGVSASSVRDHLVKAGVTMRRPWEGRWK